MKKLTVINGSPHKNGYTNAVLDIFLENYKDIIDNYNMYDEKLVPCTACNYCEKTGHCINRDMDRIVESIFSSDYVIFSSPVYCYSFPAPMKAFLDRLQPYYSDEKYKNPVFNRKGFVLASCGKSGKFGIDVIEKQSRIAFIELSASFEGIYLFSDTDKDSALHKDEKCKIRSLAEKFFD